MKNTLRLLFLKIILVITLIGDSNKMFASAENFGEFASGAAKIGIVTAIPALVFLTIPYIRNKIKFGRFFARRPGVIIFDPYTPGMMIFDPYTLAEIFIGFPLGAISLASLGLAVISKFGEYGIKNQLFSSSQFFGGLSGIFTVGSLIAAKRWHNIFSKLKKRKEKSDIIRSEKHTAQLEEKKSLFKWRFISSSLAATIFAIGALKSK